MELLGRFGKSGIINLTKMIQNEDFPVQIKAVIIVEQILNEYGQGYILDEDIIETPT